MVFPDVDHVAASSYLRELAASDCSPATIRSYAYALLRWFGFCTSGTCGVGIGAMAIASTSTSVCV